MLTYVYPDLQTESWRLNVRCCDVQNNWRIDTKNCETFPNLHKWNRWHMEYCKNYFISCYNSMNVRIILVVESWHFYFYCNNSFLKQIKRFHKRHLPEHADRTWSQYNADGRFFLHYHLLQHWKLRLFWVTFHSY